MTGCFTCFTDFKTQGNTHVLTDKFDLTNVNNMVFYILGPKLLFETILRTVFLTENFKCRIVIYNVNIYFYLLFRIPIHFVAHIRNTGKIMEQRFLICYQGIIPTEFVPFHWLELELGLKLKASLFLPNQVFF